MASLRRINQDDLRNHNLSVVIDTLLRASGPMSRADLAKETGLTKATMSLLVSLLIDAGVVKEGEPQNSASYGRPSTPLMLGGGKVCGIGMQVNTDGYGCMALDINHDILRHEWVDADMSGVEPDVVFGKLDAMAKAMAEDLESKRCIIAGVSCALPGLVTSDKRLLMARNLGWENVDLTTFDVMRGYDVTPCNEAKLAAIAQIPGYACARADVFDGVDSCICRAISASAARSSVTVRSCREATVSPVRSVTCRCLWTVRCADADDADVWKRMLAVARWSRLPEWPKRMRLRAVKHWSVCWTHGIPMMCGPWRPSDGPSTRWPRPSAPH